MAEITKALHAGQVGMADDVARDGYFFPRAWEHPGLLHIYFNALQSAVVRLPEWPMLETALRGLARFLSKPGLRHQFTNAVVGFHDELATDVLGTFHGGCFSWRWEKLNALVKQLCAIVPELLKRSRGGGRQALGVAPGGLDLPEDDEMNTKRLVQGMTDALQVPHLLWWLSFLNQLTSSVGREASWQEGCRCHGDRHMSESLPFPKRRRVVQEGHVVADKCAWKGRRSVENVLGRIHITAANIKGARLPDVQRHLARMAPADRSRFMDIPLMVAGWVVEELEYKLAFYQEWPWLILEVLALYFGGTIAQSKARARASIAFYDESAGTARIPRGFPELLADGQEFRTELALYATTDVSLSECPCVVTELIAYALAPTQERDLEAVHGKISALEKKALGSRRTPASVCAIVRQKCWSHLLENDSFLAFLHEQWQSDYLLSVMEPWSSLARSKSLDDRLKFAEIYQYDFAGQFRDASTTGQTLVAWKSALPSLNTKQAALTDVETALCQYWRSVLELGAIYSIDSLPSNAGSTGACTTRDVLDAFTHRVANHSAVAQTSRLFFDVMHLRPAGRVQAQSSGRGADTADIIVRVYDSVPASQISATPVIRAARAHTSNISLRDWCLSVNVKAILSSLLRWEFTDSISIVAIIPQSDSLRPARGPALRDDALCTTQNILNIAINAASCYGDWFPRHALEVGSVDLSAIDRLIQEGVVLRRISDDFGDEECMLEWSRLEFRLSHKLGQPELVREFAREVDDINSCAKVEALGILLRLGWVDGGSAPQPVRPDSRPPKFCLAALSKGQLYLIALLRHEFLFDRGVAEIPHGFTNNLYKCL